MGYGDIRLSQEVSKGNFLELTNGVFVTSVPELLEALKEMDNETFLHHVSRNHNDFAEWIFENYGDEDVTLKVLDLMKREKLIKYLNKILKRDVRQFFRARGKSCAAKRIFPFRSKKRILQEIKNEG
jgi:hypothetical protein